MVACLSDLHWTAALEQTNTFADLPPAVILDMDETVFDNSAFQAQLTTEAVASVYERYWGERWFLVPNPSYGSWERAGSYKVEDKLRGLRR